MHNIDIISNSCYAQNSLADALELLLTEKLHCVLCLAFPLPDEYNTHEVKNGLATISYRKLQKKNVSLTSLSALNKFNIEYLACNISFSAIF